MMVELKRGDAEIEQGPVNGCVLFQVVRHGSEVGVDHEELLLQEIGKALGRPFNGDVIGVECHNGGLGIQQSTGMSTTAKGGVDDRCSGLKLEAIQAIPEHHRDVVLIGCQPCHTSKMPMLQLWKVG